MMQWIVFRLKYLMWEYLPTSCVICLQPLRKYSDCLDLVSRTFSIIHHMVMLMLYISKYWQSIPLTSRCHITSWNCKAFELSPPSLRWTICFYILFYHGLAHKKRPTNLFASFTGTRGILYLDFRYECLWQEYTMLHKCCRTQNSSIQRNIL